MPSSAHRSLTIRPASAKALTPQQKRFNSLVQKIERQRRSLQEWQDGEPSFAQRWNAEFLPLQLTGDRLQWQLAQQLAHAMETVKLSKADRATARDVISDITQELLATKRLSEAELTQVLSLHDAHSDLNHAQRERAARQMVQEQMHNLFGIEVETDEVDLDNPAAMLRKIQQNMQARIEAEERAEESDSPTGRPRATSAGQRRREAARVKKQQEQEAFEQQSSLSVQRLFRQLASTLHPDREPDPAERERKTALMQRATTAYNENRLLDLLLLQLEVEQIRPEALTQLASEQLKQYVHLLKQQSEGLEDDLHAFETSFKIRYGLDPHRPVKPKDLPRIVTESVYFAQQDNFELATELENIADTKLLKQWLKQTRLNWQAQTQDDGLDALFDDLFFEPRR